MKCEEKRIHTPIRIVVDEDDLLENVWRSAFEYRVDGSQEDAPGLVVETDDHRDVEQLRPTRTFVLNRFTSETHNTQHMSDCGRARASIHTPDATKRLE